MREELAEIARQTAQGIVLPTLYGTGISSVRNNNAANRRLVF